MAYTKYEKDKRKAKDPIHAEAKKYFNLHANKIPVDDPVRMDYIWHTFGRAKKQWCLNYLDLLILTINEDLS